MKQFVDNAGRSWGININVDAIRRVRDLVSVDLLEAVEGKLIERLVGDPILLCDVIYALCKSEADHRGVSDTEFGTAMAGDAIDHATSSLLEELVDFFPKGRRQLLCKALEKFRQLEIKANSLVDQQLDDPRAERKVLQELKERLSALTTSGDSSGSLQASPE